MDVINYWKNRYDNGGNSGTGSYNIYAEFKGKIMNRFFQTHKINNVLDFGCGDGNQLKYLKLENIIYSGLDVSDKLIDKLRKNHKEYKFFYFSERNEIENKMLTMSIDVIYHLVDDKVFEEYMNLLFNKSDKYVLIYSTNTNTGSHGHIKHRKFTEYINKNFTNFKLIEVIKNETNVNPDFFIYKKEK